jgi:hypothetical protein
MRSNAIQVQSVRSKCNPCDPRALIVTTCDRLAVSSDDLRALATTYEDLFTSFPSICTSERSSKALHSSVFHIFTSSYMYFTFLLRFFLLFFLSPFTFLGFYTVDYIYSCTLHCSIASYNQISFPPRFAPRSHSHSVSVRPAHFGAPSQPSPITSLLLRTRLATFAHPYTCDRPCLFCFGHGQRCASASSVFVNLKLHHGSGDLIDVFIVMLTFIGRGWCGNSFKIDEDAAFVECLL